jgi:glycosyltransferase involved in cell wall biosynthesis
LVAHVTLVTEQLRRRVPGGIGTYVRALQQGLAALDDHDVVVEPWTSRLPPQLRSRLWDRGIGQLRGDVVHAPSFAFPRASGRLVVVVHDMAWREAPDTFPARGRAWHERAFARARERADHLVVPSTATADRVVEAGVPVERVTVIEEGCDHLPAPDEAGAASVVAGDFLLTVGTREPRKNLARLVAAYGKAQLRLPDSLPLVVVGPAGWGPNEELGDVIVAGAVSDAVLAGLYRRARAFVYVPLVEGFGLPPVEAMHAGAPVIASTAVPSTAGAALTVDPLDVDAIADALAAVSTDDALREDLVGRGRVRAARLTWTAAAGAHVDLWRAMASTGS